MGKNNLDSFGDLLAVGTKEVGVGGGGKREMVVQPSKECVV